MRLISAILARLPGERGQTMGEYAVLIVWIVLLVVVAATTLGHNLSSLLSSTAGRV